MNMSRSGCKCKLLQKRCFSTLNFINHERENFFKTKFKSTHVYLNVSDYKVDMDDQISRVKIFTTNDEKKLFLLTNKLFVLTSKSCLLNFMLLSLNLLHISN